MPEYSKSIKDVAYLIGRDPATVQKRLKHGKKIHGVRIKFKKEESGKGFPYMISDESFRKLRDAIAA